MKVVEIKGSKPGKVTIVMSGVHGNEFSGVRAIKNLWNSIKIDSGTVYFILANTLALKHNKRFIDKDLNRCFRKQINGNTYEEVIAKRIMPYLHQADYLLDIHNTTNAISEPFLICEYPELGQYFYVQKVISGFDILHPGGSDGFMNSIGKIGLCLECGSIYNTIDDSLVQEAITNFLQCTGNIDGKAEIYTNQVQEYIHFQDIYVCKTDRFYLAKNFSDFEQIKSGQLLGWDGDEKIYSPYDGFILFSSNSQKIGKEVFCLGVKQ